MATTTNYSWTTPDDTALVKDGAAAIRSLGTAIDTTVFTNAGAAVAKATVDAKGDLIAGTADNTIARLGVGANDTVLTADSSTATGLKWAAPAAGGMTLLSTTSLSGTSTTVSGISGSYNQLYVSIDNAFLNTGAKILIKPNSTDSISAGGYFEDSFVATRSTIISGENLPTSSNNNAFTMIIFNYASTAKKKNYLWFGSSSATDAAGHLFLQGTINTTSAITALEITNELGSTFNGGTVQIYGVK